MKPLFLFAALVMVFAATACSSGDSGNGRLSVVATTSQIGDFTANVGGDAIALTTLLEGNQDPHDFEPAPSDIRAMDAADLILRNGLHLDSFADKAISGSDAEVVVVTNGIDLLQAGEEEEEGHENDEADSDNREGDPHVWHSVAKAKIMVENIRDALVTADPDNAPTYNQNADDYLARLDDLDAEIRQQVAEVPEACRKLVTNHDVFGYFARDYGFEVIGAVIPSTTTEAQASAADVADLVQRINDEGVPAIFAESSVNPALVEQVARESGAEVIDDLYGDSLGAEGSDGATYIGMMRSNVTKITEALKDCQQ